MFGAFWKLIIFTSMVKRLINTSRNERVTLQVYDTCLQMFHSFGLRRKDCLNRSTLSSDTRCRPALFSFTKAPPCLKLLIPASNAIGRWGITVELSLECPLNRNNWFVLHKLQHTKRLLLRSRHYRFVTSQTEREEGEWNCECAKYLNNCCFVPCGKLTSAFVLIAVMAMLQSFWYTLYLLHPLFEVIEEWKRQQGE